jgi:hypothetical protein
MTNTVTSKNIDLSSWDILCVSVNYINERDKRCELYPKISQPFGPSWPVTGIALSYLLPYVLLDTVLSLKRN